MTALLSIWSEMNGISILAHQTFHSPGCEHRPGWVLLDFGAALPSAVGCSHWISSASSVPKSSMQLQFVLPWSSPSLRFSRIIESFPFDFSTLSQTFFIFFLPLFVHWENSAQLGNHMGEATTRGVTFWLFDEQKEQISPKRARPCSSFPPPVHGI